MKVPSASFRVTHMIRDIHCQQCGEPYTAYAIRHDVPEWPDQPDDAYDRFMRGEGCPTCDWGAKAGETSTSQHKSPAELELEHPRDIMRNTDEDPVKYL